jgi:uncharacterized protein (TIGR02284 family)
MAQKTQRTVLNHLIEVCRDAERGFAIAARTVKTGELKHLFYRLAEQRREFAQELLPHAQRLEGAAVPDGTPMATLHRAWIRVRARVAGTRDRAVLEEAARGERFAVAAYDDAVHDRLPPDARDVIEAQDLGVRVAARLIRDADASGEERAS